MIARRDLRIRDPFVLTPPSGGFVLYGSTDPDTWSGPGVGFDCYRSDDLELWEGPTPAFRPPAGFWGTTQFWAPEVYAVGGRFLMFATFSDGTRRGTQALVAPEPAGPFVPWGDGPMTPVEWSCLDGTLHVEDGVGWVVYCHEWSQIVDGRMVAQRLDPTFTRAVEDPVVLFSASEAPWTRPVPLAAPVDAEEPQGASATLDGYITDGPFLYRSRTGELLMLWSSVGEHGYAAGVARSASGRVLGPWEQEQAPLWPADGGHAMLFAEPGGALRLALHQPNGSPHERAVFVDVEDAGSTLLLRRASAVQHGGRETTDDTNDRSTK